METLFERGHMLLGGGWGEEKVGEVGNAKEEGG